MLPIPEKRPKFQSRPIQPIGGKWDNNGRYGFTGYFNQYMHRLRTIGLASSLLILSWLLMQVVHECGHATAAWLTGGKVIKIVLHPLAISRTDIDPNPQPLIVAWSGPLLGGLIPIFAWAIARTACLWCASLLQLFAGFCLIANGIYLSAGSIGAIGDAGDLLRLGAPAWVLWVFGVSAVLLGFHLWHRLGPSVTLANVGQSWAALLQACLALAVVLAIEWLVPARG